MREATFFTFDGISSEDMGVQIASPNGGLFEDIFLPNRRISETVVRGRKPYFLRVDEEPLSFPLTFFIYDWKNRDNIRAITRWLFKDYYKPLYFNTNPNRIFYTIIEGNSTLFHNGLKEGYVTLNIRCDSPYSYSPVQTLKGIESRASNSENKKTILSESDMPIKPVYRVFKRGGNGDISIENETTSQILTLSNLQDNEEIFIDCNNEEIVSSLENVGVYRYKDHNDVWTEFAIGDNYLKFHGDFDLEITYEFIYLND